MSNIFPWQFSNINIIICFLLPGYFYATFFTKTIESNPIENGWKIRFKSIKNNKIFH